jgi:nucleoside-triphosphatase THEP1
MSQRKRIYILSSATHSGKTTTLLHWAAANKNVQGILTPVEDGRRFFMNAFTKEKFEMEAAADEAATLPIGRFIFSKKNFEKAIEIIEEAATKDNAWLVIDEIGPLELKGLGFSDVLKKVLAANSLSLSILLVVRNTLVEEVVEYFRLDKSELDIVGMEDAIFNSNQE